MTLAGRGGGGSRHHSSSSHRRCRCSFQCRFQCPRVGLLQRWRESMAIRIRRDVTRRRFLTTAASTGALVTLAKPYVSRAADRPMVSHGVQSGDVSVDSGMVWARADRPARMQIEIATTDSFKDVHQGVFVDALPESDLTAKALIEGLPAGQDVFYRIRFQDLSSPTVVGEPMVGRF